MLPGQTRYYRLDLKPEEMVREGHKYKRKALHHWSPEKVFAQDDLYTTKWGTIPNTEIEQFFFGRLDAEAKEAVQYWTEFDYQHFSEEHFNALMVYMSVQKMRTPKGLAYLSAVSKTGTNVTLIVLQEIRNLYCAVWTEAIWQIAHAMDSPTKFIISDHPVTVYNRACPHLSKWCLGFNDPDIRMNGSHTFFPLSLEKVLILTNVSWLRNPYQNELTLRPNPEYMRNTVFCFTDVQTERKLTEDEVLQINLITKRRAYRYIAAAEEEWLYPERHVSTDHWRKLGGGYLLMPEPRRVYMGGEIFVGYKGGGSEGWGEYGYRPWQKGFKDEKRHEMESETLERFKAEWAMLHGPKHTAICESFGGRGVGEDSEDMMRHYREVAQRYRRRSGHALFRRAVTERGRVER
jgi:hypothetical protein